MKSNRVFIGWLRWPISLRIATIIILLIILFGQLISLVEPEQFPNVFEGIWWALITVSTVGYGDYVPKTPAGQIVGMLLVLLGAAFVTAYFATMATAAFHKQQRYAEGKVNYKGRGHMILIGWNEKANKLMRTLQSADTNKTIVLIDETLREGPLLENIHFIRGYAADDAVLQKANIEEAEIVFITADQHKNEADADMQSILTLLAVKGLNPSVYCLVEILTERQRKNAERAGANQIFSTAELLKTAMLRHFLIKNQLSDPLFQEADVHLKIHAIPVPDRMAGSSFQEAVSHFMNEHILIIGVQQKDGPILSPSFSYTIKKTDKLLSL
ncbi:potassium channel protein [Bacillus glycinifermentans]|uniref:Potassium channel family protein n=1 Tax=Bacillus glycinifermentans TaxID=1664069 RepID=A0A0J6DZ67_9BACI|nr:potassium channel family protein [Bacillus glycinifermentans]ATH92939.1 potassium channel protein [Bacillus glycinifermentans]KMM53681.1 potassium channel protein [Bacillus glycinifermentans]KRT94155.1 potassium channel protein [Bacillus glycinifermentans]MEC0486362.1 potassium channel family protein [Bacillus glycinifermentans]MEC0493330.1 potassium channel family protein [Bacillus glycinifermentans]